MNSGIGGQRLKILIVEDNPCDVRLAEEIIAKSSQPTNVSVAEDGEQALAMLKKEGEYSETSLLDLILLNLELPKLDGTEILAQINADPDLVTIPVMIVTGSEAKSSLIEAYRIPPSRYTRKPIQLNVFNRIVDQLGHFSRQPILIPTDNERQDLEMAGGGKRWWWPFN